MKLIVKKIKLENFKGIRDLEINFKEDMTNIFGDNGTGKTTIFDAFSWLLWDKDSLNRSDFEIKTLDENGQTISNIEHSVEAVMNIDDNDYCFKKTYKEVWTKKRGSISAEFTGHTTDYYINDVPARKKDYVDRIGSIITEDEFKLLSNVNHFNVNLDKKQRRNTLLSLVDDIDTEEIINSNEDFKLLELNKYKLDEVRAREKATSIKINKEIQEIPARIDELTKSIKELCFEDLEKQRQLKADEKSKLDEQLSDYSNIAENIKEISSKITNLELEKNKIIRDIENNYNKELQKIENDFKNKDNELIDIKKRIKNIEQENSFNAQELKNLEQNLEEARNSWVLESEKEFNVDTKCPTCNQELPFEEVEKIKETFNINKSKKLESIELQAYHLKNKIEAKQKCIDENSNQLVELELAFIELNRNVEDIDELKSQVKKEDTPARISEIDKEIESLKQKLSNLNNNNNEYVLNQKNTIENEIKLLDEQIHYKNSNEQIQERISELKKQEKELAVKYEESQKILNICDEYIKAYTNYVSDSINEMFKFVNFKLFDTQINGGITETCEATVKGVPYSDVNNAGKINAGLDIINVLSKKLDKYTPIFIDNAESVNELISTNSQIIRLVVSNDKELKVN